MRIAGTAESMKRAAWLMSATLLLIGPIGPSRTAAGQARHASGSQQPSTSGQVIQAPRPAPVQTQTPTSPTNRAFESRLIFERQRTDGKTAGPTSDLNRRIGSGLYPLYPSSAAQVEPALLSEPAAEQQNPPASQNGVLPPGGL